MLASDSRKRASQRWLAHRRREEYAVLKPRSPIYSPLWQADRSRIRRVAPLDFIRALHVRLVRLRDLRYEAHQLANDTAQG